jgi:hypothetical protein
MSRELTLQTEKTKLEEKFEKRLGIGAARELVKVLEQMTKPALEARLLALAKANQGIINTKNSDEKLEELKYQKSVAEAPYREQVQANKELTRFVSLLISDKFGDEAMDIKKVEQVEKEEDEA